MPDRAVIFDVDGVLVDSYEPHFESWKQAAKEAGFELTPEQFATTFGRTSREIIRHFWGESLDDAAIRKIDDRKEAFYREIIKHSFPAMDGAVELIDQLREAGFALAVASSGPPENVELTLELLGRRSSFQVVVTGRDVTRGKPDPQVFLIAAERLGMEPRRCAVIEDAPAGVEAATAAGTACIALLGTADRAALAKAREIVASLRELTPERIASIIANSSGS